ncbi:MAG: transpeptidase family protein [Rikenellaceae bacterium]|nr:transpeptidase family protein [Rikenellaceae bacterium]MCL2692335.1 transpeptidase family protein [Rikenellaceae bacterium]
MAEKKRTIGKDILRRARWLYVIFLLTGMAIVGRIVSIQYGSDGDELRERAEDITFRRFRIPAERGDILGRDGRILATTIPEYEIRMDFGVLRMTQDSFSRIADTLARSLAQFFGDAPASHYKTLLESGFRDRKRYERLNRRKVSYTEEKQIAQFPLFRAGRFRSGYIAEPSSRRFLPSGSLARSVIGSIRDDEPVRGLELQYDSLLRGTDGFTMKQKISGSFWIPVDDEGNSEPENGFDIVTTIDADIQDVAENMLRRQLREFNAYWGTVILMEVATGEIVAMSNLGRMDGGDYGEIYNYAIGTPVEPGSTFKLATLLALLDEGGMRITDMVDCRPDAGLTARVGITDVRDVSRNGILTLGETFEQSSNIGFARSIQKHFSGSPSRFVSYIRDNLRMGSRTGIDLIGERTPLIVDPSDRRNWHGKSLVMMSYGYGLEITPLHTLVLYNTVANNGRMMRPMLVREVRSYGETLHRFEPEVLSEAVASPSAIRAAQSALAGVVEAGTGRNVMRGAAYTAVAKTGTAQQVVQGGGYRHPNGGLDLLCTFTGYFPIENPKYSCIVVIKAHERPGSVTKLYGSNVAGPVFRAVADRIYARTIELHDKSYGPARQLPSEAEFKGGRADVVRRAAQGLALPSPASVRGDGWWAYGGWQTAEAACATEEERDEDDMFLAGIAVPSVVGKGLRDAIFMLDEAGFTVRLTGAGRVIAQSPAPNAPARPGQVVQLTLGN